MAPKPWTKADYELRKEPSAGNHGTADVLPRLVDLKRDYGPALWFLDGIPLN